MKKIIISMLLSMFMIYSHAQSELPYKSLSDFNNDTTAFINYNFIDRAEQYKGKTIAFLVRDLQLPVRHVYPSSVDRNYDVDGLYLSFYEVGEMRKIRKSILNRPYTMLVKWEGIVPDEDYYDLRSKLTDKPKIVNHYKDFKVRSIFVFYPSKSEHEQNRAKLRSTKVAPPPIGGPAEILD